MKVRHRNKITATMLQGINYLKCFTLIFWIIRQVLFNILKVPECAHVIFEFPTADENKSIQVLSCCIARQRVFAKFFSFSLFVRNDKRSIKFLVFVTISKQTEFKFIKSKRYVKVCVIKSEFDWFGLAWAIPNEPELFARGDPLTGTIASQGFNLIPNISSYETRPSLDTNLLCSTGVKYSQVLAPF